jgi:16S rRNA (guanine527-N7)-methyltransferase
VDAQSVVEDLYRQSTKSISDYIDLLTSTAVTRGLIGPREADRVWDRHILNSISVAQLIPPEATVIDVGSGAGLPGIPLAILRDDVRVTLLEPLLRRSTFLGEVIATLQLGDRVSVVRGRAEDHRQTYDVVVARALAPLDRLLGWCAPLRRRSGVILALKGETAVSEVEQAEPVLRQLRLQAEVRSLRAHPDAAPATVVVVQADP